MTRLSAARMLRCNIIYGVPVMRFQRLCASTALITTLAAVPAFAVTPEEIWKSWQDLSASYGQTLTTESVVQDGSDIVVTGLKISQTDAEATVETTIDELSFVDNGDGTVLVSMSESFPLTMTFPDESGAPVTIAMQLAQPGLEIVASGDATATKYDFTLPEMTVKLDRIEGTDPVDLAAQAVFANLAGSYLFGGPAEARTLDSSFSADSMTVTVAGNQLPPSPEEGPEASPTDLDFTLAMTDIAGTSTGTILSPAMMADLQAAMASGFASTVDFTAATTTYNMDVTEASGQTRVAGTGGESSISFAMGDGGFSYGAGSKNLELTMNVPEIPIPDLKLSYGEATFSMALPIVETEEPRDFAFLTRLVDLKVSDEIWAMFDPGAVLPRDPATVIIDTKGKARVTADLSDPAALEGDAAPGELHALDVTELRASIGGAELTGEGAFTFDNTDLVTFGGMPAPTGKLDLRLVGGNALMEKLVTLGILSAEDVMGANMMLSMFANPGPGEDEMSSTLEFKDKGFYANGQRLQ